MINLNNGLDNFTLRENVFISDRSEIRQLLESTNCFYDHEVDIAIELIDERLTKGASSGYNFIIATKNDIIHGYTCFGLIPCTQSSFDLYWIAVNNNTQGQGLGGQLLEETEKRIKLLYGTRIYIETSSRDEYRAARSLYKKYSYKREAIFSNFYAPKDDKIVFMKEF